MAIADSYDVVCVGGQLSSYLTGALLARRGMKVLIVDEASDPKWPVGYESASGIYPALSGSAAGPLRRVIAHLDYTTPHAVAGQKGDADLVQLLTPVSRTRISSSSDRTIAELSKCIAAVGGDPRSLPELVDRVWKGGHEIPDYVFDVLLPGQLRSSDQSRWKNFWGKWYPYTQPSRNYSFGKLFADSAERPLERLLSSWIAMSSYAVPHGMSAEQALRAMALAASSDPREEIDLRMLQKHCVRLIESEGGTVRERAVVSGLVNTKTHIEGVVLGSFEGVTKTQAVVLSTGARRIYSTLSSRVLDRMMLRALDRVVPSHWLFSIALRLQDNVVPQPSSGFMVHIGAFEEQPEGENQVQIRIMRDKDKNSGECTIVLSTLVPFVASSCEPAYLRRLAGRMLHVLDEVVPFFQDNLIEMYPDVAKGEQDLIDLYGLNGLASISESLHRFYVRGAKAVQSFWGPSWNTPHSNLYIGGRYLWPVLGVDGEALAAEKIASDLLRPKV